MKSASVTSTAISSSSSSSSSDAPFHHPMIATGYSLCASDPQRTRQRYYLPCCPVQIGLFSCCPHSALTSVAPSFIFASLSQPSLQLTFLSCSRAARPDNNASKLTAGPKNQGQKKHTGTTVAQGQIGSFPFCFWLPLYGGALSPSCLLLL
jgi:hypothetical protein